MKLSVIGLFIFALALASPILAQPDTFINSGVYIGFDASLLAQYSSQITKEIETFANAYKIADQSGKDGDIKYTLSGFSQSVALGLPYYQQSSSGASSYALGFKSVNLTVNLDYKVCIKKVVELCENGKVTIQSTSPLTISSSVELDLSSAPAKLECTATQVTPTTAISVSAHCTSKICSHTHDVSDKISQEFVPMVETSITTGINSKSSEITTLLPGLMKLNFTKNGYDFLLDTEGTLVQIPSTIVNTPTMIMNMYGAVILSDSKGQKWPSQKPTLTPSKSVLQNVGSDVVVTVMPFFVESLCDAVLTTSLPITFTSSEVPAESPVKLNTSDPFFLEVAPGLVKYPDQEIYVVISSRLTPNVIINSTGVTLNGTNLYAQFYIDDDKEPLNIFSINFFLDAEIKLAATIIDSGHSVNITSNLVSLVPNAYVSNSEVGDVDATGFVQLIQLLQSFIKLPSFAYPIPKQFTATGLSLSYNEQCVQLNLNFNYSPALFKSKPLIKINKSN